MVAGSQTVALILGGTSGLGLELARESERNDVKPMLLGRSKSLEFTGDSHVYVDLADKHRVYALCQYIEESYIIPYAKYFFWNAAMFERASITDMCDPKKVIEVNVVSPTKIIESLIRRKKSLNLPVHIVAVSSTSSWRARADEAVYCGTKAYQSQFMCSLGLELMRDLPGSKVTIVHPSGMKTNLFNGMKTDTSKFMDPAGVAKIIWSEVLKQDLAIDEFNVDCVNSEPVLVRESRIPLA